MFHTPNIELTALQAECLGLPIVQRKTKGEKESELSDLKAAIAKAVKEYKIEGVVTGAVRSTYQTSRIQKICAELGVWVFNPLWLMDQVRLLEEVMWAPMDVILGGVFAEGMSGLLGRKLDQKLIDELAILAKKKGINPAGEGGEFESAVLDAPLFKKRINLLKTKEVRDGISGVLKIEKAEVVSK